jgi:hypothetical protein
VPLVRSRTSATLVTRNIATNGKTPSITGATRWNTAGVAANTSENSPQHGAQQHQPFAPVCLVHNVARHQQGHAMFVGERTEQLPQVAPQHRVEPDRVQR